ncbi:transmembrane protein, partial [Cystoisospora suis]
MQGTRVSPSRPPSSPSPSSSAPPPPSQTVAKTSSPPPSSPSFLPPPSNTPYTYYIQPSYAIPYIPPGGVYTHQPPRQHALDQGIEGGGASSVPLLAPSSSSSHPSLSSDERDYRYFERRRTTPSMRNEGEDSQASSQGCACCWTSLSPSLLAASALGAWLITGGLGGEIVLLIATFPAILLLYGLHVSVRSKSLSLIVLTEFFWLGAFLSVFIAMCLEVLANALFYSSLLSCLPPLPTSTSSRSASSSSLVTSSLPSDSTSSSSFLSLSSSSFVPLSSSSSGDISEFLFSSSSDSIVKPPLLAPLSLPFYFPLIGYSSTEEDENRQRDCLSSSFFSSCPLKKNNKISSSSSQILSSSSSSTTSAANKGEVQGGRKDRGKEQEEEREREQGNLAFSSSSSLAEGRVNAREMIPDFLKEREERTERDRREESWMDFLSKIASKEVSYLRHPLPTFLCSLGLVAFMICCVGLVEEFAKFVVLRRLKVVPSPSPPIWGGTVSDGAHDQNLSLLSHHVDAAGRAPPGGSDAEGGGGCGGFWSRYVKYPVGICLAGCAAGAGFAVAENLSYTLGRRGPFEEHLIVAIVRTFTAIPSHIANTGLAASTLAMS